jgi:hypothetical protein
MCDLAHSRAKGTLRSLEEMTAKGVPFSTAVSLLADVWSVVDTVHRIRELIEHAPLFPKNQPNVRAFLVKTAVAEELRHYVQHLAGKAKGWTPLTPFWGAISWASENQPLTQFTLVTSDPHLGGSLPGLILDRKYGKFVSTFQLEVGKLRIDLNDVADRVRRLDEKIGIWTKQISFGNGKTFTYRPDTLSLIQARWLQVDGAPSDSFL